MPGVVDERDRRAALVAKVAGELDDRRHRRLLVLFAAGGFHPGERVEHEQARTQFASDRLELVLPSGVIELDPCVRGEDQPAAEGFGVDVIGAGERVQAPPQCRASAFLVAEHDRAGVGIASAPNAGRPVATETAMCSIA